jgi:hypothetical protein
MKIVVNWNAGVFILNLCFEIEHVSHKTGNSYLKSVACSVLGYCMSTVWDPRVHDLQPTRIITRVVEQPSEVNVTHIICRLLNNKGAWCVLYHMLLELPVHFIQINALEYVFSCLSENGRTDDAPFSSRQTWRNSIQQCLVSTHPTSSTDENSDTCLQQLCMKFVCKSLKTAQIGEWIGQRVPSPSLFTLNWPPLLPPGCDHHNQLLVNNILD